MRGLSYVVRAEAFRLSRSRSMWWSVVFLALLAAARVFAAYVSDALENATEGGSQVLPGGGWGPFVDGWRTALSAATLLLLMHAARTISADREHGILRVALTRSSTRTATVVARALLALPIVAICFAVTGLASFSIAQLFYDFGPLSEDGYELLSVGELRGELVASARAVLPALYATYAFGLMLSAWVRSPTLALSGAVCVFLAFDLFKEALGEAQYWVFAAFVPSFVDGSALSEMASVARGFSDAGYPATLLDMSLVLPCLQALVFVILACIGVNRRAA